MLRFLAVLAAVVPAYAFTNGTDLACWCGDYTAACGLPACATGADVTVDFNTTTGPATQRGSGVLHSLFRNVPGDPLLPAEEYVMYRGSTTNW